MKDAHIRAAVKRSQKAIMSVFADPMNVEAILWAGHEIASSHVAGGVTFVFGNGGSASQAEHLVGELMGFLREESRNRTAIRAMALTTPSASVTCVANDEGYDSVFSRQLTCLGPNDFLIGLTTSGKSENVVSAVDFHKSLMIVGTGGKHFLDVRDEVGPIVGRSIVIDSGETPRVQEATLLALHLIAEAAEESLHRKLEEMAA